DGKVTAPVKGATLIGNGPDALTKVTAVANDLSLDEGVGTCGKDGQSVPVGVGLPTIKISEMTVGGTKGLQPTCYPTLSIKRSNATRPTPKQSASSLRNSTSRSGSARSKSCRKRPRAA